MWIESNCSNDLYYIACCYYPPRPVHTNLEFCEALSSDIDAINTLNGNSIIVIAGDFNQLDTNFLCTDFGLTQIVEYPTDGQSLIDKIFVNRPDIYVADVFQSIIKTKHCVVLLNPYTAPVTRVCKRRQISFYDLRSQHIDRLRYYIGLHDWSDLYMLSDIELVYNEFVSRVKHFISNCVPRSRVTLGPKDPKYITPLIKSLLRRRYRLRRRGLLNQANELAVRINTLITENRRTSLNKLVDAGQRELWAAVKTTAGYCHSSLICINPDCINKFFADISTNNEYGVEDVDCHKQLTDVRLPLLYDFEVEQLLSKVSRTAAGCDDLPAWLFRHSSYELAGIVSLILNCSFSTGVLPSYWLHAIVTPVPKVNRPFSLSDYKPIYVKKTVKFIYSQSQFKKFKLYHYTVRKVFLTLCNGDV